MCLIFTRGLIDVAKRMPKRKPPVFSQLQIHPGQFLDYFLITLYISATVRRVGSPALQCKEK
jgi:hypothetical protein